MIQNYHRPVDLKEAAAMKAADSEAVYLAGGTQVNRAPLDRELPKSVIDLRDAVPSKINTEGTDLVIGAMASLQDVCDDERVPLPLRNAAGFIPTRSVRNQATIGGNIGAGRSDSYIIPTLIALDAVARTTEGNIRVEEYVSGNHQELILDIHVPVPVGACIAVKESRSHLALPVVSAAVSLTAEDASPEDGPTGACVAVGCVAKKTIRLTEVEEGIVSGRLVDRADLEEAIRNAVSPRTDILGSAEFKKHVNGVVIADAVVRCLEELS